MDIVGLQTLINGSQGHYCTMWEGTFYCGTSDGFHYLRHKIMLTPDLLLKIKVAQLPIVSEMDYSSDPSKWLSVSELIDNHVTELPAEAGGRLERSGRPGRLDVGRPTGWVLPSG